jgi:hypothetical protein
MREKFDHRHLIKPYLKARKQINTKPPTYLIYLRLLCNWPIRMESYTILSTTIEANLLP